MDSLGHQLPENVSVWRAGGVSQEAVSQPTVRYVELGRAGLHSPQALALAPSGNLSQLLFSRNLSFIVCRVGRTIPSSYGFCGSITFSWCSLGELADAELPTSSDLRVVLMN